MRVGVRPGLAGIQSQLYYCALKPPFPHLESGHSSTRPRYEQHLESQNPLRKSEPLRVNERARVGVSLAELLRAHCKENWGGAEAARVSAQLLASPQPVSHFRKKQGWTGSLSGPFLALMQQDMCRRDFIHPIFIHTPICTPWPLQWQTHRAHGLWLSSIYCKQNI